ncbi:hypothetical protein [Vibrio parahaemolyticus]|uniref:hypothetical protein n=1 Tax=Vibrio parahaemolyticus TaxID=670 RepID=UPI002491C6C2|nr:hypothetical protein [Vibrio parahaemolyticus]
MSSELEREETNTTIKKAPLEMLYVHFTRLKDLMLSQYKVKFEKVKFWRKNVDVKLYIKLTISIICIFLLAYFNTSSNSKDESMSISKFIVSIVDVLSDLGAFLAGIGTVLGVYLAYTVKNDWKEQKIADELMEVSKGLSDRYNHISYTFVTYQSILRKVTSNNYNEDTLIECDSKRSECIKHYNYFLDLRNTLLKLNLLNKEKEPLDNIITSLCILIGNIPTFDLKNCHSEITNIEGDEIVGYYIDPNVNILKDSDLIITANIFVQNLNDSISHLIRFYNDLNTYIKERLD